MINLLEVLPKLDCFITEVEVDTPEYQVVRMVKSGINFRVMRSDLGNVLVEQMELSMLVTTPLARKIKNMIMETEQ